MHSFLPSTNAQQIVIPRQIQCLREQVTVCPCPHPSTSSSHKETDLWRCILWCRAHPRSAVCTSFAVTRYIKIERFSSIHQAPLWSRPTVSIGTPFLLPVLGPSGLLCKPRTPCLWSLWVLTLAQLRPSLTLPLRLSMGIAVCCPPFGVRGPGWPHLVPNPFPSPCPFLPQLSALNSSLQRTSQPIVLYFECPQGLCFYHFTWKPISQSSSSHCLENFSYLPLKMFFS